jgi:DNA mismatch repair protein MutL
MPIKLLPAEVASQIAAGEVVERPASVVKELLENALDAGASSIWIEVEEGGRRLVEVGDDGDGIPLAELPLAVARHATSKLGEAEDLFRIASLGFRGEALAAIGSVARMTVTSRSRDAEVGGRIVIEGGQSGQVEKIGTATGTLVKVEDLFFNVPARLKFLKTESTERRQIDGLVTRYALAYPNVRFQLKQEGRVALQTSGNGDIREVLGILYGSQAARQMLEVLADYDEIKVSGFISPIALTRSNRREITFFVNGRLIQDVSLTTALVQAYHSMLMVGRFPLASLFLEVEPEKIDVNVHPTKAEVRFREKDAVFSGVQRAVRRALLAYTPVPRLTADLYWNPNPDSQRTVSQDSTWVTDPGDKNLEREGREEFGQGGQAPLPTQRTPLLRLVGQIAATYLVAEGPDGLYLIDQHAAHERVLYERFMAQRKQAIPAQILLEAAAVHLPGSGSRLISEQLPVLERLGFKIEEFGVNTFLVRAIPALLSGLDPEAALRVLVEDFEEDETPLKAEIEARIIARVCKRAAIKAGQILREEEQAALIEDLAASESPRTCPHGRPTMIHLSVSLLERQFGRRGS